MDCKLDKHVFSSEDAIAFWGCMFVKNVDPETVYRCAYAGLPTEIQVFAYPQADADFVLRSIDCWFAGAYVRDKFNLPVKAEGKKVRGYRMAWYTHDPSIVAQKIELIHSALIFGRCFFYPTREEFTERYVSRVQHLFGTRGLNKADMKRLLLGRTAGGYTFCNVILKLKELGIEQIPVDFLRMWACHAVSSEKIERLMTMTDDVFVSSRCSFCLVTNGQSFLSVIKMGNIWVKVIIKINGDGKHCDLNNLVEIERKRGQFVCMSATHMITYGLNDCADSSMLTQGRCFRWGHRLVRSLILGVDSESEVQFGLLKAMYLSSLRAHSWKQEEFAQLFRFLWVYKYGVDGLPINRKTVLYSFDYFHEYMTSKEGFGPSEVRQMAIMRSELRV